MNSLVDEVQEGNEVGLSGSCGASEHMFINIYVVFSAPIKSSACKRHARTFTRAYE